MEVRTLRERVPPKSIKAYEGVQFTSEWSQSESYYLLY